MIGEGEGKWAKEEKKNSIECRHSRRPMRARMVVSSAGDFWPRTWIEGARQLSGTVGIMSLYGDRHESSCLSDDSA